MSARSVACIYKNTNNLNEFLPAFTHNSKYINQVSYFLHHLINLKFKQTGTEYGDIK